ncbi:hypothetical protein NQ318_013776 [Aromia moschata]|uniref:Uncharacterized protein n=1 Tax=Aromia moschata TaxID=1265417 RepID=A0AAV8ZAI7_9CUCU|nr:hypothetical protein NQ318_013776 [Aromia moschata]
MKEYYKTGDTEARMEFCLWLQGMYLENPDFLQNILYTDEATFTTNGIVSSQNIRMWRENNPHWVIECKIRRVTDALNELRLDYRYNLHLQLDGAPIQNAVIVRNWLNENFPNCWIGKSSPLIRWPPKSPDITPLGFFLWGAIKNKVYATRPQTREELSDRIRETCQSITRQQLRNIMRNNRRCIDWSFHKSYWVTIPSEEEEKNRHMPVEQDETIWYTDRSKIEQNTEAGTTCISGRNNCNVRLYPRSDQEVS